MSKLENWGDLFKYNKELLEDDYNQGQGVVIKTKSKATDNVTVSQWESVVEEVLKAQRQYMNLKKSEKLRKL